MRVSVGPSGTGVVQTAELKSKIAAKKPSTSWGGQVTTMKPRPLYPGPRFQGKKVALLPLESGSHAWWTVMTDSGPSFSLQRESQVIPLLENTNAFSMPHRGFASLQACRVRDGNRGSPSQCHHGWMAEEHFLEQRESDHCIIK